MRIDTTGTRTAGGPVSMTVDFAAHKGMITRANMYLSSAADQLRGRVATLDEGDDWLADAARQVFFAHRAISDTPTHLPYTRWVPDHTHGVTLANPIEMPFGVGQDQISGAHALLRPISDAWRTWNRTPGGERAGSFARVLSTEPGFEQAVAEARTTIGASVSAARNALDDARRALIASQRDRP